MDAKWRPSFVITPKRHIELLEELTDDELHQLWLDCVEILEKETAAAAAYMPAPAPFEEGKQQQGRPRIRWEELVINQRNYRNLGK